MKIDTSYFHFFSASRGTIYLNKVYVYFNSRGWLRTEDPRGVQATMNLKVKSVLTVVCPWAAVPRFVICPLKTIALNGGILGINIEYLERHDLLILLSILIRYDFSLGSHGLSV